MGKKTGRILNPADLQRKLERKKELKRNKKQRTETREAVVKSRDPEELIEQIRNIDEQIYNVDRTAILDTLQTKRKKHVGAFISIIALNRQQKNNEKAKELQNILDSYENERRTMEERYNAIMFAKEGSLESVPLPSGVFNPGDVMTPACMIPIPPSAPQIHSGILKKPIERRFRKTPPGPPCIPPPDYDDFGETAKVIRHDMVRKGVKFDDQVREHHISQPSEENYEPVEIPAEIHNSGLPSLGTIFPQVMSIPLHPSVMQPPRPSAPIQKTSAAVISAPAQVKGGSTQPVISAAPQMRDLWKETTRFVPTNIHVKKNSSSKPRKAVNYQQAAAQAAALQKKPQHHQPRVSQQPLVPDFTSQKGEVDPDKACDDFLSSLQDLL